MKTMKKLAILISFITFIFTSCEKDNKIETKADKTSSYPTELEYQKALNNIPVVEGWNGKGINQTGLKTTKSMADGEVCQITSAYYSDGGTYFIGGHLYVYGCVPSDHNIHIVYWLYDFAISQWKNFSTLSGKCMQEDNLDMFIAYYSNSAMQDFYVLVAAQVYIEDAAGNYSLWNTFYSNVAFLDGPY